MTCLISSGARPRLPKLGSQEVSASATTPKLAPLFRRETRPFLSREGDLAQAVSFLPGFPDGSFGWAKVRWHLPNAAEMPKLFVRPPRLKPG